MAVLQLVILVYSLIVSATSLYQCYFNLDGFNSSMSGAVCVSRVGKRNSKNDLYGVKNLSWTTTMDEGCRDSGIYVYCYCFGNLCNKEYIYNSTKGVVSSNKSSFDVQPWPTNNITQKTTAIQKRLDLIQTNKIRQEHEKDNQSSRTEKLTKGSLVLAFLCSSILLFVAAVVYLIRLYCTREKNGKKFVEALKTRKKHEHLDKAQKKRSMDSVQYNDVEQELETLPDSDFKQKGNLRIPKEFKGPVKHGLDNQISYSLKDVTFDFNENEEYMVGTCVEQMVGEPSHHKTGSSIPSDAPSMFGTSNLRSSKSMGTTPQARSTGSSHDDVVRKSSELRLSHNRQKSK